MRWAENHEKAVLQNPQWENTPKSVINYIQVTEEHKDWEITVAFGNMEFIRKLDE